MVRPLINGIFAERDFEFIQRGFRIAGNAHGIADQIGLPRRRAVQRAAARRERSPGIRREARRRTSRAVSAP